MVTPISNPAFSSSFCTPPSIGGLESIVKNVLYKTNASDLMHLAAFCQLFEEQRTVVFKEITQVIDEQFVRSGILNIPPNSPIETYQKLVTTVIAEINSRRKYEILCPQVAPLELFLQCVENENIPGLSLLLQKSDITPQNIDQASDGCWTGFGRIIEKAIWNNHFKVIKFLKSLGFDIEYGLPPEMNLLTWAATYRKYALVTFLIQELGINPNLPPQNPSSETPLTAALGQNDLKMIWLLLSLGAEKTFPRGDGKTPLELGLKELLTKDPAS